MAIRLHSLNLVDDAVVLIVLVFAGYYIMVCCSACNVEVG